MGKTKKPVRPKKQKTAEDVKGTGRGTTNTKDWQEQQEKRELMKRIQKLKDEHETWDHKARHETYESLRNREWEANKKAKKTPTIERQVKANRASKAFEEYKQYIISTHPPPQEPNLSHMVLNP